MDSWVSSHLGWRSPPILGGGLPVFCYLWRGLSQQSCSVPCAQHQRVRCYRCPLPAQPAWLAWAFPTLKHRQRLTWKSKPRPILRSSRLLLGPAFRAACIWCHRLAEVGCSPRSDALQASWESPGRLGGICRSAGDSAARPGHRVLLVHVVSQISASNAGVRRPGRGALMQMKWEFNNVSG